MNLTQKEAARANGTASPQNPSPYGESSATIIPHVVKLVDMLIFYDNCGGGRILRRCPTCQRAGMTYVDAGKWIEATHHVTDRHWTCVRCQRELDLIEREWLVREELAWMRDERLRQLLDKPDARPAGW